MWEERNDVVLRSAPRGAAALAGLVAVATVVAAGGGTAYADDRPIKRPRPAAGVHAGTAGLKTFATQVSQARMAPYGSVAPGEYSRGAGRPARAAAARSARGSR